MLSSIIVETETLVEPDSGCSVPFVYGCVGPNLISALLVVASTDFLVTEIT